MEEQTSNIIASEELSEEAQLKLEIIQSLLEPCDRATYGKKLKDAAQKLGKSVRTVQRLVKRWEEEGVSALSTGERSDKGDHRIDSRLKDFILKTYREGNKGSKRMTRQQVYLRTLAKARELGLKPLSHMTVYRVLQPLIEAQEKKKSIRSPGWRGSQLSLKTRSGQDLSVEYSNYVWQCDHTRADVLLVDKYGDILGRPWLTTVIDTYSRCIVGFHLGYDAPSSQVVALALRHAMLPKQYGEEYKLHEAWGTYGKPEHFFTDGGKDFRSNHLQQISVQLGFVCHLRDRPSEGGIVERPFKTFNTEFFSTLKGYTGSNVQERPKDAEKDACLTLRDLEQLFVRYIVDRYNQQMDARMGEQTRLQRWESGLLATPDLLSDRELDICLMKQTRRKVQRGGYLQFENLMYQGENLEGYTGENVTLRYDPKDITTLLVYRREGNGDAFLARAYASDLEKEHLSLDEAKAMSRKLRNAGKTLSNYSLSEEVRDAYGTVFDLRDQFVSKKKTKKERQKEEQAQSLAPTTNSKSKEVEPEAEVETVIPNEEVVEDVEVLDYDEIEEDYGW